ncbi:uncharacterized protein LOC21406983 [Morus notabilis]|uniref:uncharacterized protein LOC21406983 n=1 Tax=Morus notabilis TaxID=981085 RepID=UPI000CED0999|nr:uncharacterized protein LOC21406983 [Morus notabilis]
MKANQKDSEKLINPIVVQTSQTRPVPKLLLYLMLFICVTYVVYTLRLISSSTSRPACDDEFFTTRRHGTASLSIRNAAADNQTARVFRRESRETTEMTEIKHVVFGIAASSSLWSQRKNYIKLWYRPRSMRGVVWMDGAVESNGDDAKSLPPVRISSDTSSFPYANKQGHRSALRISRIVSETLRLGLKNVRWFVMGDDDTVFVTDNLVRILRKYDHNQMYYIGSLSESHLQNIFFSYGMAYGGGGFAISFPLAKALAKMQDRCIHRYPGLYGSDDRMQACMAELGVPLTKEVGFHQYDVYGNLFGLLAAHPVTPLVSLHHLDIVEPIFPNVTRIEALQRLNVPIKLDSAAIMQQSICYHKPKSWTVSVSWGFAVQIFRGVISPREMEMPSRTFLNWYRRADYTAYAFNTRPVSRNPCQKPFVFYFSKAKLDRTTNQTITEYVRHRVPHPLCRWKMADPSEFDIVKVFKKPDPDLWNRSPRRNCCRIMDSQKNGTMLIDVGVCKDGEVTEL